jgi:hypothetical protein
LPEPIIGGGGFRGWGKRGCGNSRISGGRVFAFAFCRAWLYLGRKRQKPRLFGRINLDKRLCASALSDLDPLKGKVSITRQTFGHAQIGREGDSRDQNACNESHRCSMPTVVFIGFIIAWNQTPNHNFSENSGYLSAFLPSL